MEKRGPLGLSKWARPLWALLRLKAASACLTGSLLCLCSVALRASSWLEPSTRLQCLLVVPKGPLRALRRETKKGTQDCQGEPCCTN